MAQLAEQLTRIEQVAGSNPATSSKSDRILLNTVTFKLFKEFVMNKKRLDVRRIHLGITPKADAKQKIEAALTDEIEMKLDEADKAAAADSLRYKENEVFSRCDLRKQK